MSSDSIQQAAHSLNTTQLVTVLMSARVSQESCILTFRDALNSFWAQYDPQHGPSGEMLPTLLEALGLEA